jgi:MFS family permease
MGIGSWFPRRKPSARDDGRAGRSTEAPGDPAAYALLLNEALRSLSAQEASLDELRMRSGSMLSAAGVIAAFLGTATLTIASGLTTKGPNATDWWSVFAIYVGIFLATVGLIAFSALFVSLLPSRTWVFRVGTKELLRDYIEATPPASLPEIHRSLAWYLADGDAKNAEALKGLYRRFSWGAILFLADLVLWLIVLGAVVLLRLQQ